MMRLVPFLEALPFSVILALTPHPVVDWLAPPLWVFIFLPLQILCKDLLATEFCLHSRLREALQRPSST